MFRIPRRVRHPCNKEGNRPQCSKLLKCGIPPSTLPCHTAQGAPGRGDAKVHRYLEPPVAISCVLRRLLLLTTTTAAASKTTSYDDDDDCCYCWDELGLRTLAVVLHAVLFRTPPRIWMPGPGEGTVPETWWNPIEPTTYLAPSRALKSEFPKRIG